MDLAGANPATKPHILTGDRIYMSLSSRNENANDSNISFQIRLTDSDGRTSTMHINDFGGVVNPINTLIFTPLYLSIIGRSEPVLQWHAFRQRRQMFSLAGI